MADTCRCGAALILADSLNWVAADGDRPGDYWCADGSVHQPFSDAPNAVSEPVEAVHGWFGLSYANYAVLPRTLLQSMPDAWQARFVALMNELDAAFDHIEQARCYQVQAATEHEVSELSDVQLEALGITRDDDCEHQADDCDCSRAYHDADGREMDRDERVLIPCADPVAPYNRGRTRIEPGGERAQLARNSEEAGNG